MANALLSAQTTFLGSTQRLGKDNGSTITMRAGGTKQLKKVQKAVQKPAKQAANVIKGTGAKGFRRYNREALWLPNTERPEWLDGTLPGDRGFDPLGLARPTEYLQMGVDSLDQNKAVNKAGDLMGKFNSAADKVSSNSLSPYNEVFGLERFRECELIHGRWAMLATLGAVVAEASTGVSWVDAGKVELDGAQYLGLSLPFTIGQLCWIEAILVGGAEIYRNTSLDIETRLYPGGAFDPLGLASGDDDRAFKLKTAEIKHARLAMVAFLGYGVQALTTGEGALGSLAKFADTFGVTALDKFE